MKGEVKIATDYTAIRVDVYKRQIPVSFIVDRCFFLLNSFSFDGF